MTWCWLIGHWWVELHDTKNILGEPFVFCARCTTTKPLTFPRLPPRSGNAPRGARPR